MAYTKRDWDNTGTKVTKEDFKKIESGIESNDLAITVQGNQINVLSADRGYVTTKNVGGGIDISTLNNGIYTGYNPIGFDAGSIFNAIKVNKLEILGRQSTDELCFRNYNIDGTLRGWQQIATTESTTGIIFESGWVQTPATVAVAYTSGKIVNVIARISGGSSVGGSVICTLPYNLVPSIGQIIVPLYSTTAFLGTAVLTENKLSMIACNNSAEVNLNFSYLRG